MSEKWAEKFHAVDVHNPTEWCFKLDKISTSQKHYPDQGNEASSVLEFLCSFLTHHFAWKLMMVSWNVGSFVRLQVKLHAYSSDMGKCSKRTLYCGDYNAFHIFFLINSTWLTAARLIPFHRSTLFWLEKISLSLERIMFWRFVHWFSRITYHQKLVSATMQQHSTSLK